MLAHHRRLKLRSQLVAGTLLCLLPACAQLQQMFESMIWQEREQSCPGEQGYSPSEKTPSSRTAVVAGLGALRRNWWWWWRSFLFHSVLLLSVHAQQRPFTTVPKFDTSVSYRTDLCPRQRQIWDGTLAFPDGLRGLNLTVAIADRPSGQEKFLFSLQNGHIREKDPGYFAIILDEIARRAGFFWRDSFVVYEPRNETTDGNKTWTDILLWSIEVFDISLGKWGHSVDRMALGVSFPVGFFDGSLVLGELYLPNQSTRKVDLWSFLEPFDTGLWLVIVVTVIFSGMIYWLIEHWNKNADELELANKPIANIFYAAIAFTGHYQLAPQTHPARLLGFSLTFWALIVSSSYTANLASFLVSPRVYNYKYSTMEEVVAKGAALCMQSGGILLKTLEKQYPGIKIVGKDSEIEIFAGLRLPKSDGGCDVAGHDFNMFELYEHSKEVNFDCAISSEKRVALVQPSGMATAIVDSCTSLVSHILDYHLTSMMDDGFIEQAWKDHLSRHGTIECIRDTNKNGWFDESDTFSLTLVDVGGIFIVHVVLSLSAIAIATYHFYDKYKKGLLPESRNLGSAFGIDFARKKFLRQEGRRSLVISDGGNGDSASRGSETGSMAFDFLSKSYSGDAVKNIFDNAVNEVESGATKVKRMGNRGLTTKSAAVCQQNSNFYEANDKGTSDCDTHGIHISEEGIQDSSGTLTSTTQYGNDGGSSQDNSKEERKIEKMGERLTI